jgi:hypothetical protein
MLAAAFALLAIGAAATLPARADDFGKRVTVIVAPNLQLSTTGDSTAAAPPGGVTIGKTTDHPLPNTVQLDYGLNFRIDKKTNLYYSHSNFVYTIGRVLTVAPHTAFEPGEFFDHTDTIGINHALARGLVGRAYYFDQQRQDVTGLCLSQISCGNGIPNTASINMHGYGLGFNYDFGPKSRIGQIFTASFDAKYFPRASTTLNPNLGSLGKYVGTQTLFPYGITAKIPVLNSHTVVPFIGYERADVLYQNEAVPEVYNVVDFGIVKVINKNATFSITNLNLTECKCEVTVPAPDNIRIAELLAKLELKTSL